jgi:predicted transcriptional regulator
MDVSLFDTLFGSRVRARLLRLFLLSPDAEFDATEAAKKVAMKRTEVVKELNRLAKMRFVTVKTRQRKKIYQVRNEFPFYQELKALVSKLNVNAKSEVFKRLRKVGDVKLVLISGLFINYPKSKVDMVLVINSADKMKLRQTMQHLESEAGKEVRYVLMNTEEFHYRLDMLDRFLMEFLEGPYESVIDKLPELKRFVAGL